METYWYYVFEVTVENIKRTYDGAIRYASKLFPLKEVRKQINIVYPDCKVIISNQIEITKEDYNAYAGR